LGEHAEQERLLHEVVTLSKAMGEKLRLAAALNNLGNMALEAKRYAEAQELFQEALAMHKNTGHLQGMATALDNLGTLALQVGNLAEARRYLLEGLRTAAEGRSTFVMLDLVAWLAAARAREGHVEQALEWWAMVMAHPATLPETKGSVNQLLTDVIAELPPEFIAAAQARGQTLKLEAVTQAALALQR
jgi:tetratricopeptide (TPR) repeat protein